MYMHTNTWDTKSVQKCMRAHTNTHIHTHTHTHTDSCIIASCGLSLCGANIQRLEVWRPEWDREKGLKGGWQKMREEAQRHK